MKNDTKLIECDVSCGECGAVIDRYVFNEAAMKRDHAEGQYFQFHARDAMNDHMKDPKVRCSGSTSRVTLGAWKDKPDEDRSAS